MRFEIQPERLPRPERLANDRPVDIATRDLYYGSRGKEDMPGAGAVFTFEKEDLDGTNPKYVVRDAQGTKWKAKLGDEAKPEPLIPRLQTLAVEGNPWRYSAREAIALLTERAGQRESAAKMFSDLARDPGAPSDLAGRARALADLYSGK